MGNQDAKKRNGQINPSAIETPNTNTEGGTPGPTEEADPVFQLEKTQRSRKREIEKK